MARASTEFWGSPSLSVKTRSGGRPVSAISREGAESRVANPPTASRTLARGDRNAFRMTADRGFTGGLKEFFG